MITKAQIKHIRSLDDKKYRTEFKQFVVEGEKMIAELLNSNFDVIEVYATLEWFSMNPLFIKNTTKKIEISKHQLSQISHLNTANEVVALVSIPKQELEPQFHIAIALDNIQDPGNLGSIIRIADWYGIHTILCNLSTVDCFNPKVIRSTMGSIFRVSCYYINLLDFLKNTNKKKYGAVLNGKNINEENKIQNGIIVIGNESHGIQENILQFCDEKISIPRKGQAESLNAAIATGIICNSLIK